MVTGGRLCVRWAVGFMVGGRVVGVVGVVLGGEDFLGLERGVRIGKGGKNGDGRWEWGWGMGKGQEEARGSLLQARDVFIDCGWTKRFCSIPGFLVPASILSTLITHLLTLLTYYGSHWDLSWIFLFMYRNHLLTLSLL
ncbi:hypothetical protein B0H34DRAFT_702689 [Crassisporium funariophilum]|nr:hypothetical protein B0H34DRAFT_702689 [Crassisporium funariophilum]